MSNLLLISIPIQLIDVVPLLFCEFSFSRRLDLPDDLGAQCLIVIHKANVLISYRSCTLANELICFSYHCFFWLYRDPSSDKIT